MGNRIFRLASSGLLIAAWSLVFGSSAWADEPQKPEELPPPRTEAAEVIVVEPEFAYSPYSRRSAYDVWQSYGVNRFGYWRPRVIAAPYGAYYHYNGEPYFWTTTHSLEYMPYVVD
jgi:hypothetical protein